MVALLVSLACLIPPDGAGVDSGGTLPVDTGDSGEITTALDALLSGPTVATHGCQWAYLSATAADYGMVAQLTLPPADEATRTTLRYDRSLQTGETLSFAAGSGSGSLSVFDCSDTVDTFDGVHLWTATAATISITATFLADHPEWTCDGASENPVYTLDLIVTEGSFVDESGAPGTLTNWGPASFQVGETCGG